MTRPISGAGVQSVLVIHRGGDRIRGSEVVLLGLLDALPRNQFKIIVACQGDALGRSLRERGIEVHEMDLGEIILSNTEFRVPLGRYVRALWRLRGMIAQRQVSLVMANGGAPCQVGVPLAAIMRLPFACLMHHPAQRKFQIFWLTRFVRTMIYVSEHTARHTRSLIGRGGIVVHPGVDIARMVPPPGRQAHLRQQLGIAEADVVFGQVGALVAYKGQAMLVEAFASLAQSVSGIVLVFIGDGEEAAKIREAAISLGVEDKVRLAGFVPDVLPYFQHVIDVNILPSSLEGLGLVTLEAAACGIPTIGADATGIRETIVHRETGLLVEPGSAPAFADAMLSLARDGDLRRSLGRAARAHAVEHFSMLRFAARVGTVMQSAIDENRVGIALRQWGRWSGKDDTVSVARVANADAVPPVVGEA